MDLNLPFDPAPMPASLDRPDSTTVALPTRPLGRTDMAITRVGFGAWAIGGPDWAVGWGAQDDSDSVRAIRHALERGINWIDTIGRRCSISSARAKCEP